MGVFPAFGAWINQNSQQSLKAPTRSDNVESKSVSEMDTNNGPAKMKIYYDKDEWERQEELWKAAEKKNPWYDAPPKVKVTTKNGLCHMHLCHMHIELTLGLHPDGVFELFTDANPLLKSKSRKVLMEDGPRQIVKVEKAVAWDFHGRSFAFPITLIFDENRKNLTAKYKKEKMVLMKVFEGSYKVEPLYVDSVRLCKHKEPKSVEEYKKCSGGQGKIASKVTMDQYFQPISSF